jgi:excisionase family DNA binding protein
MPAATRREYLTLPIAADRLNCHVKTIRRLIASGHLTGYRIGRKMVRVDATELDQLAVPIPTVQRPDATARP